jgi:predicted KAP-like P-loop ATPase
MWSDNETIEDLLGFRVHADLIKEVVTNPKLLPITMAIFGDWGSGKTSIMKMLQNDLSAREDIAVLYFDAWLFEGYDDAKSALISSILSSDE